MAAHKELQSISIETTGLADPLGQTTSSQADFASGCHFCKKKPSVYWCPECQRSLCEKCNNQHWRSDDTCHHIVQHVHDTYVMDYKFNVSIDFLGDMKLLHDEMLVIADSVNMQLVTCHLSEQQQQQHIIPLDDSPCRLAVVDNNTVAVLFPTYSKLGWSLHTFEVVIVNVRQRQVIQKIILTRQEPGLETDYTGIMHKHNQLFIGCFDGTIKVIEMSGKVSRTIPVGAKAMYICDGKAGIFYYTDDDKLYCSDTEGKQVFSFSDPDMNEPEAITTDDEGHVLVISSQSNTVLRVSPDGKQHHVIIKQVPSFETEPFICYSELSKSVVIGRGETVYVYKKV